MCGNLTPVLALQCFEVTIALLQLWSLRLMVACCSGGFNTPVSDCNAGLIKPTVFSVMYLIDYTFWCLGAVGLKTGRTTVPKGGTVHKSSLLGN